MSLDRIAGLVRLAAADADLVSTLQKQPARLQVPLNLTAEHLQVLEAGRSDRAPAPGALTGAATRPNASAKSPASLSAKAVRVQAAPFGLVTGAATTSPSPDGQLLPPEGSGQPPSPVIVQTPGPAPSPVPRPSPGPQPQPAPSPIWQPSPSPGPTPSPYQAPVPLGPMPGPKPSGKGPFGPVPGHPGLRKPSPGSSDGQASPCSHGSRSTGMDLLIAACADSHCCCLEIAAIVATVTETAQTAITAITAIAEKR
jgi:hypothetical protein